MTLETTKKEPKLINVTRRPTIIIGEKMGNQRPGEDTYALEGNRTGDFVHEAIEGKSNIILTNIVNYFYKGNFDHKLHVKEGMSDLEYLLKVYHPRKIICLGTISYSYVSKLQNRPLDCAVVHLPHPSFVNRFLSSQRGEYIQKLRNELN